MKPIEIVHNANVMGKAQLVVRLTLIDLTEDNNAGELRLRIVGDGRVEEKDTYLGGQNTALMVASIPSIRMFPPCLVATST